jgi:hypothetical protein
VTAVAPVTTPARPPESRPARPVVVLGALVLLLAVYGVLALLNNPRGTLGTDTGGKLATLAEIQRTHSLDPDIGYWAEAQDPDGRLHPLWYTHHIGDGWVNVTTLPMLVVASPLYDIGGERAVLLLPMLGAAFAALAARALSRRASGGDGWLAFWTVGLASPIAIYALDFWEHAPGVAFVLWAIVFMYDLLDRRAGWCGALAAGALFGAAATMRTESLVYAAVAAVVVATVLVRRTLRGEQPWSRNVQCGSAWLVGIATPLVANQLLERALIGGAIRASRAAGTAGAAGVDSSLRVEEAMTTTMGVNRYDLHTSWLVGALAVLLVAYAVWRFASSKPHEQRMGAVALVAAFVLYLVRFADGLDFVPGVLSASPLAAVGVTMGWTVRRWRVAGALALLALPVVWVFQYSGGANPQWGGRYVLVTGTLLVVGAAVVLPLLPRASRVALIALAVVVTAGGLAWLSQRSHTVADAFAVLRSDDGTVLVSRESHLLREGGAFYGADQRWLTATTPRDLRFAAEIASDVRAPALRVVSVHGRRIPSTVGSWTRIHRERVEFVPGIDVDVVTYVPSGGA